MEEGRHAPFQKQRFQLIFYISLPVLIITTAILIKRKKLRELCYRGETESERYVYTYIYNVHTNICKIYVHIFTLITFRKTRKMYLCFIRNNLQL